MENNDINKAPQSPETPIAQSAVKFRLSKAFIAYVVISLIIIISAVLLLVN